MPLYVSMNLFLALAFSCSGRNNPATVLTLLVLLLAFTLLSGLQSDISDVPTVPVCSQFGKYLLN